MKAIMKKTIVAMAVIGSAVMAMAATSFEVKNVEAHQRYPWNGKVDIDFQLTSANPDTAYIVEISCVDNIGHTNLSMRTVQRNDNGEPSTAHVLKAGNYRLVWNADADCPNVKLASISFSVSARNLNYDDTTYLVIDLSGGANASSYPVTYLTGVPVGGWTDEYKTTKLVMRKCSKGGDPLGRYTLTQDFFAGVFEVTQKQWNLVMGTNPSRFSGNTLSVESVSYNMIRGSSSGSGWPSSSAVDADSFIGKLRTKTGLPELDLPTEAQWEYACRAGSTATYNLGDSTEALGLAGWYSSNSGSSTHAVGGKLPNNWGLYDMHGNVREWCLDWYASSALSGTDPKGSVSGSNRCYRGGNWSSVASYCTSSDRDNYSPSSSYSGLGFRLFRTWP